MITLSDLLQWWNKKKISNKLRETFIAGKENLLINKFFIERILIILKKQGWENGNNDFSNYKKS